jgi:two-component system, OmpR family, heavy metal sensor histidine kinase CusS
MRRWSLKVKVGLYAALLTVVAMVAGSGVMMWTLYFHQVSKLDAALQNDAQELVRDIENFRDAPADASTLLSDKLIPVDMREDYLIVEGTNGKILYQSENLTGESLPGVSGQSQTIQISSESVRVGVWQVGPYLVRVGAKLSMIQQFQKDLGIGLATALPVVALVVFFGGLYLGRRAVAPVAELSAAADRISAHNPTERLPLPPAQDEIFTLTEVLNRSFDRLQDSYEIAMRFSADASHQLKTPVAILRAGLDHLSRATDLSEAQSAEVSILRQQTRRLTALTEDLLLLAQADAGRMSLEKVDLDFKILIQAASEDLQVLVEGKHISVEEVLDDSLRVHADRRSVTMVLQSLIENAAKYTPPGGRVRISGFHETGWLVFRIANTGKDIPEEEREQIFERFRRGTEVGGSIRGYGLGLNIAKEFLAAHGGSICLNSASPGWIEFEFRLPVI